MLSCTIIWLSSNKSGSLLTNDIVISSPAYSTETGLHWYNKRIMNSNWVKLEEKSSSVVRRSHSFSRARSIFFFVCDHQLTNISFACYTSHYMRTVSSSCFLFIFSSSRRSTLFSSFSLFLFCYSRVSRRRFSYKCEREKCCEIWIRN